MTEGRAGRLVRFAIVFGACVVAWTAVPIATTVIPLDLTQLTGSARAIARGEVVDVRTEWAPGRRRVQTRVTIAVSEYYKGQLGAQVSLVVPGGQMGRYRSVLVGAPRFEPGQSVVVFLGWRDPALPYIVGFSQGLFRVVREAATGRDVVTPRPLVATGTDPERVERGDPTRRALGVDEFKQLVRSLVRVPGR